MIHCDLLKINTLLQNIQYKNSKLLASSPGFRLLAFVRMHRDVPGSGVPRRSHRVLLLCPLQVPLREEL